MFVGLISFVDTCYQVVIDVCHQIDVPAEAQLWFYQAQQVDETKTLDQLKVDIGAILEVKCQV